jgi:hypothetical protein
MRKLKLYIACALTKAPQTLKDDIARLKAAIRISYPGWEILEFYGLGQGITDGEVFLYDVKQVMSSDIVVAIADVDSTGLGEEAGMALILGKPLLFAAHIDWKRTRMVTGPAQAWPASVMFEHYSNISMVTAFIAMAIDHFKIDLSKPAPDALSIAPHVQEFYRTQVLGRPATESESGNPLFMREAPVYADHQVSTLASGSAVQAGYESTRGLGWKS